MRAAQSSSESNISLRAPGERLHDVEHDVSSALIDATADENAELPNTLHDTIDEPTSNTPPSLIARAGIAAKTHANVIGTVGTFFGTFLIFTIQGVLMARLLGPEKRGEYGTAVLFTQSLLYIGLFGTHFSIAGRAARDAHGLADLRRASIKLGLITGAATFLVVTILALTALPASKAFLAPLCIACALGLPFDHIRLSLMAVDHGSGAFPKYNKNLLFNAAMLPLGLAVLWIAGVSSLQMVVAITVLAPVAALIYRAVTDGRGSIGPEAEPSPRTLLVEGVPYAFAQTASNLFDRLDALLMLWLVSFTVQGYYTAAVSAAGLMIVAPNALALFTFRAGAQPDRHVTSREAWTSAVGMLAIQAATLAVFFAIISPLIVLVFGESFRGAIPFAKLLLIAQAINGFGHVAGGYLRGLRKPIVEVWSRVIGAAVMIVMAFALRESWQDLSVPLAAICAHAASALLITWAVVHHLRQRTKCEAVAS